jgi:hypothetical protein
MSYDPRTNHVVATYYDGQGYQDYSGGSYHWHPPTLFRTIFSGWNLGEGTAVIGNNTAGPNAVTIGDNPQPGTIPMMNPVGLGYLAGTGYIEDMGVYFCPSATGMPADRVSDVMNYAATTLAECKQAGGTDPQTIARGNWGFLGNWVNNFGYRYYVSARVLQSHYNYRMVPSCVQPDSEWYYAYDPPGGVTRTDLTYFCPMWVRPYQRFKASEPVFKTQKQISSRAVVSDSFSKDLGYSVVRAAVPGMGYWAHRDGYNVLYGDWIAKWYGDTQSRIMWWPRQGAGWTNLRYSLANNVLGDYWLPDYGNPNCYSGVADWGEKGHVGVWHSFDVANGMDVGVDRTYSD